MKRKQSILYRAVDSDIVIDEEKRTVKLSFSSEEPVERWEGNEILDHDPKSVQLARLENGGPLLVDHDPSDHVGVVENVSIDADRVGRALVRFGKGKRATEIFNDVIDGIRKSISVGYRVFKAKEEDDNNYRVVDWMPLEISFVSVPADATVGVGRGDKEENDFIIEKKDRAMPEEIKDKKVQEPPVDVKAIADKARKEELNRVREITAISNEFEVDSNDAINDGMTVDNFRVYVLDNMKKQRHIPPKPATEIGLTEQEQREYSLFRAIQASISGNWKGAEFERECSVEISERLNKEARGFYVPYEMQRVMTTAAGGVGAVGTDHLAENFIDALRNQSVVAGLGAQVLNGLVGDVDIPRLDTGATFYWVTEDADLTNSDGSIGSVTLSPKTVGGSVPMSRRLLKQSAPSAEQIIRNDLIRGAAIAIDAAAINGSGAAGQPTGIISQVGVNSVAVADLGMIPTFAEAVAFETAIETDNALAENMAYLTTPAIKGSLKTTLKSAGVSGYIWEMNEINGYQAVSSNQCPAANFIMGDFSQLLIGMWGVLDISPDTAAKAASGGLILRVFQDVDIAVRHPTAFGIGA
ncbi:MAG: phage major capsid protein [Gammaproteobacteria bacterium]